MPATQEQVVLDESVRMVMVQFACSNPSVIPENARERRKESPKGRFVRKHKYVPGQQVIEPVENISLSAFLGELEQAGYVLVDAFSQRRKNTEEKHQPFYYVARFSFVREEYVQGSEEFEEVREVLRHELQEICNLALWRVRAFKNLFFHNGEQIPGQYAVSINFEARTPHPTTPNSVPLTPKGSLRIVDNSIQLLPA